MMLKKYGKEETGDGKLVREINKYMIRMSDSGKNCINDLYKELQSNYQENIMEWQYYNIDAIWDEQIEYAKRCLKSLEEKFNLNVFSIKKNISEEKQKGIAEVRAIFGLFCAYEKDKDKSYKEWFGLHDKLIKEYNISIDELLSIEIS